MSISIKQKIEDLRARHETACAEFAKAQAIVDTDRTMFSMGEDIPRATVFKNHWRARHWHEEARNLEIKLKAMIQNQQRAESAKVAKLRIEAKRLNDIDMADARRHKEEMRRINAPLINERQEEIVKRLRALVGDDAFMAICEDVCQSIPLATDASGEARHVH